MIVHDMLGLFERFTPKFVKQYANLSAVELEAFTAYRDDVKSKAFPQPEHFYKMVAGEAEKLESNSANGPLDRGRRGLADVRAEMVGLPGRVDHRVGDLGQIRIGGGVLRRFARELRANASELAAVEEDAAALRALVDRDLALDAPEVAHHDDPVRALRADVALRRIDDYRGIARDAEQRIAERLGWLVDLTQLVVVEPDAAAAAVACIDGQLSGGPARKRATTCRTVHVAGIGSKGSRLKPGPIRMIDRARWKARIFAG